MEIARASSGKRGPKLYLYLISRSEAEFISIVFLLFHYQKKTLPISLTVFCDPAGIRTQDPPDKNRDALPPELQSSFSD